MREKANAPARRCRAAAGTDSELSTYSDSDALPRIRRRTRTAGRAPPRRQLRDSSEEDDRQSSSDEDGSQDGDGLLAHDFFHSAEAAPKRRRPPPTARGTGRAPPAKSPRAVTVGERLLQASLTLAFLGADIPLNLYALVCAFLKDKCVAHPLLHSTPPGACLLLLTPELGGSATACKSRKATKL